MTAGSMTAGSMTAGSMTAGSVTAGSVTAGSVTASPVTASSATVLTDLALRVGPVMVFLVAITVVAEIADAAGVFDIAGHWAARAGRGRTWLLWLLIVGLSCLSTIVLSLDTTAVLLTPVVIAVARQLRLNPLPFAMTTVWLANTASLLLPVSNLTNLLALQRFSALGRDYSGYISLALWPAMAAIAATVAVLALLHWRDLRGQYRPRARPEPHDRVLLIVAATVCVALGPAFVSGITPAIPASVAALALVGTLLVRNRPLLREIKVPWLVVLGVSALFVAVDLALSHGLRDLLAGWVGTGNRPLDLLRVSAFGAGTANVVDNLPAYLALESVTDNDPDRLMALLIGVNAGPLVTVWASLATILWRERCRRAGVTIRMWRFAWQGAICATAAVLAAALALALT
jgi:arsenical pump membrane protein